MSYQNLKSLSCVPHRTRPQFLHFALALVIAMLVPIIASAYTIVLRNGRHKEIPATFTVNGNALTYEWAPGFNITLSLSVIDIAATERINHEPPGSFLRRASASAFPSLARTNQAPTNQAATLTITNADLEHSRRVRVQSEKAYEQRRRQLGLPSADETRRLDEQQAQQTEAFVREYTAREGSKEAYWRTRASDLRVEVAEVDSQIYYLQSRIAQLSPSPFAGSSLGSYTTIIPNPYGRRGPFWNYGGERGRYGYGRGRGTIWPPYGTFPTYSRSREIQAYETSYERSTLVEQLNNLLLRREGLAVRWRLLEDEARRAGAYPGWLRP